MLNVGFGGGIYLEPSLGAQQGEPGQRSKRRLVEPSVLDREGGLDANWCKGFLDLEASQPPVGAGF